MKAKTIVGTGLMMTGLGVAGFYSISNLVTNLTKEEQAVNQNKTSSEIYVHWKSVDALVTNYTPTGKGLMAGKLSQFEDGKTATMKDAFIYDGVAVDPRLIPYGSKILIPGVGLKIADDTGGRIKRNGKKGIYHLDIRVPKHDQAMKYGKKKLKVHIFKKKNRRNKK